MWTRRFRRSTGQPHKGWKALLATLCAAAALTACDEEFVDPAQPGDITGGEVLAVSGSGQSGALGALLPQPLRVQVKDERGRPAARQVVEFRTLLGDGLFSSTTAFTDFAGFTQVSFVPLTPGDLLVEATGAGGGRALFALFAVDSSEVRNPASFTIAGGNNQTGAVGTLLPQPITVRVLNADGNPLPRLPVIFTATTDGTLLFSARRGDFTQIDSLGGEAAPTDTVGRQVVSFTDEAGVAGVLVRLRTQPGVNEVRASATFATGSSNVLVFTATGTSGGPSSADSIVKISGDNQSVAVDTVGGFGPTFSKTFNPMVVQVTDRFGNPLSGVRVFFRISNGSGSLSRTEVLTDSNGTAETTFTSEPGSSGGFAVSASAPGVGTVTFTGDIEFVGTTPEPPDSTGGGGGGGGSLQLNNIAPDTVSAGGLGFTLTALGASFDSTSLVRVNGSSRTTTFDSSTQLRAAILASDIATVRQDTITVAKGSAVSNALILHVQ